MVSRARLPNRRESITTEIALAGWPIVIASVGLGSDGRPLEVFLRTAKPDSQFDRLVDDAAVSISIALQYGAGISDLAASVARRAGMAQTPIGAALAFAPAIDAEGDAP